MKLLALEGRFVNSRLLLERKPLVPKPPKSHDFVEGVALESMLLAPLVQTQLAPAVLAVEEPVVDPVVGPIPKSTTTTIKAPPMQMLLGHLRTTMKPASICYRSRFLIETTLPITCSLMIIIVEQCWRFGKIQMPPIHSIVSHVEGNIILKTVPH